MAGSWQSTDYTFTEGGSPTAPSLTAPTGVLSGSTQFTWNPGAGNSAFYLRVGITGPGSLDLYGSGTVAANTTSETVNIPSNGADLFVTLGYEANGVWSSKAYTFTESGTVTPPALTSPSGSTPLAGSTSFTWTPGAGSTRFRLEVSAIGPGQIDVYDSGSVPTSVVAEPVNIPTGGQPLYVRLAYYVNGTWLNTDYTFTEGP